MLIPFGILSAAGAGGEAGGTYELIESTILESAASSVTFSSLDTYASDYKHLQIRSAVRSTNALATDYLKLTLNADTGSNYSAHDLFGNGSAVQSFGYANLAFMGMQGAAGSSASANIFGSGVLDILDAFSTTKNKTIRSFGGDNSSSPRIYLTSGSWRNLDAISSISIDDSGAGNLDTGSRFSLYGIRG